MSKILNSFIFTKFSALLDKMAEHPELINEKDKDKLNSIYSKICKGLCISEHTQWRCQWQLDKWFNTADKLAGRLPDERIIVPQNIVLDVGAEEILKLIADTGGATSYSFANAYMYVGTNATAENASQTGLIATGANRAFAGMDAGYPVVSGRQVTYRGTFGDSSANFHWQEMAIYNGTGANAVAMNRKVQDLGIKTTGSYSLQTIISVVSA